MKMNKGFLSKKSLSKLNYFFKQELIIEGFLPDRRLIAPRVF
jgi:hypothetical protein